MTMSEDEEKEAEKVDFFLILWSTNGIIHQTVKKASHHIRKKRKTTKLVHLYYIKNETDLGCVCVCAWMTKEMDSDFIFLLAFHLGFPILFPEEEKKKINEYV